MFDVLGGNDKGFVTKDDVRKLTRDEMRQIVLTFEGTDVSNTLEAEYGIIDPPNLRYRKYTFKNACCLFQLIPAIVSARLLNYEHQSVCKLKHSWKCFNLVMWLFIQFQSGEFYRECLLGLEILKLQGYMWVGNLDIQQKECYCPSMECNFF